MNIYDILAKDYENIRLDEHSQVKLVDLALGQHIVEIVSRAIKKNISLYVFESIEKVSFPKDLYIIKVGERLDYRFFEESGFQRVSRVWNEEEYSVIGDIYTFWRKGDAHVTRISTFDGIVENIDFIDQNSRQKISELSEIVIKDDGNLFMKFASDTSFSSGITCFSVVNSVEGVDIGITSFPSHTGSSLMKYVEVLSNQGYKLYLDKNSQIDNFKLDTVDREYKRGFLVHNKKFGLITGHEILGKIDLGKSKKSDIFSDISIGDYVVHQDHGIGIYSGVIKNDMGEYIEIKYANDNRLLVPLDIGYKLSKYVGSKSNTPKLTSLNSGVWARIKSKAKEDIMKMAKDLIALYAVRSISKIKPILESEHDLSEFEEFLSQFEYMDTEDQVVVTQEIINDFKRDTPMDRLLIGDVGFGKTEIAMRAAYLAVNSGTQVLVIAPTTILSMQHFEVFKKRFEKSPFRISVLNRFITKKEREKILEDTSKGLVDILISTHLAFSDKLKFNKLGLLILDEEQKFGVTQKENLKKKKVDIHVLSMSATPIPRTLNMSLSGIRDLSIMSSAPEGRVPIQNFVGEYDFEIVRKAIVNELSRGGQVYYVHNRIADLNSLSTQISESIPDSKIAIIHGRMGEDAIDRAMKGLLNKEINVLISSTIIENGIDVPTVNTIIIDDADRYGLSTLYQLRGRVGRYKTEAYAYFLYPSMKGDSKLRLEAIKELNNIGSGFILSTRDLEIRGAGNILGKSQSGTINSVGYAMYVDMLNESIVKLQASKYIR